MRRRPVLALLAGTVLAVILPHHGSAARARTGPRNPDFEVGDLTGWTVVSGNAFSAASVTDRPTYADGPFHQHGRFHLYSAVEGDDKTGILESDQFTVDSETISFLVSGGNDPQRLLVQLVAVTGEVLHSQTGPGDEAYVRVTWDVDQLRGMPVFFRLVDATPLGHINLDDIRTVDAQHTDNGLTFTKLGQDNQPAWGSLPAAEVYAADPHRPQFHYTPYQGWINDPNGLIEWRGRHHLFAQYYPERPQWGPMHWAHADGDDPVHFRNLPIALRPPALGRDESGIFSGSAVDDGGVLTLVYTIYTDPDAHPGAIAETVGIATSTDGVRFLPYPRNPVIDRPPPSSEAGFRDPKVFRDHHDGRWKMVIGSGDGRHGKIHLYASDDLRRWDYLGVLLAGDDGPMWECPSLFEMGGRWVVTYSVLDSAETTYVVGDFDGRRFTPRRNGKVDHGPDFFAAQHYEDSSGRALLVGWLDSWEGKHPSRINGYAGALSVARELFIASDGGLGSRAVSEMDNVRTVDALEGPASGLVGGDGRLIARGDALDVRLLLNLALSDMRGCTVAVHSSGEERTELRYNMADRTLTLDTSRSGYGTAHIRTVRIIPNPLGRLDLRLLIDRSTVEVFIGDGTAMSARVYPRYAESRDVSLEPQGGGAWVEDVLAFRMGSSWR